MNQTGRLDQILADFDAAAFGERVGRQLLPEATEAIPALALADQEDLAAFLGTVGLRAVGDLVAAASLLLAVEGPEDDPMLEALEATIEGVRLALGMLSPTTDVCDLETRRRLALQGLDHLARMVTSWDQSKLADFTPTEEPPRP